VTVRIREYQKRRLFDGEPTATHPLDAPPIVFETVGLWIELPPELATACAERELHFMGGIHAVEHAAIGLFPLLAISDRGDIGGISYTGHPQTGGPAVFVYDGVAGGAGLAERGFADLADLVARTLELVRTCPCESGCPGCIQSPKCGNGNKPLDKEAALLVLRLLAGEIALDEIVSTPAEGDGAEGRAAYAPSPVAAGEDAQRRHGVRRSGNLDPFEARRLWARPPDRAAAAAARAERVVVFDLETQRGADEVGGWGQTQRMGLALAVVYDATEAAWRVYRENGVDRLLLDLAMADRVIGFNIDRFDLRVLSAYCPWDLSRIRTLDLLSDLHRRLGFRLSLGHLAAANFGEAKGADGLRSLEWWRQGRVDLIERYCRQDVDLTRRLYERGRERGFLLYHDHAERLVRVPVDW
jgi:DEAD/DEAH box helicase domain-containing protein